MSRFKEFRNSGFSLVEILIVVGVMGAVGIGISTLLMNLLKSAKTAEFRAETLALTSDVRQSLDDVTACARNFGPAPGLNIDVGAATDVNDLVDPAGNVLYTSTAPNNIYGNRIVRLTNIRIGPSTYAGPHPSLSTFQLPLRLTYNVIGEVAGSSSIVKILTLNVMSNAAGRIRRCSTGSVPGFLAESVTPNGYVVFPNGLIMQWGRTNVSGNTVTTVNFNIPFPNAAFSVVVSGTMDSSANSKDNWPTLWRHPAATTNSSFRVFSANGASDPVSWYAVGN